MRARLLDIRDQELTKVYIMDVKSNSLHMYDII